MLISKVRCFRSNSRHLLQFGNWNFLVSKLKMDRGLPKALIFSAAAYRILYKRAILKVNLNAWSSLLNFVLKPRAKINEKRTLNSSFLFCITGLVFSLTQYTTHSCVDFKNVQCRLSQKFHKR